MQRHLFRLGVTLLIGLSSIACARRAQGSGTGKIAIQEDAATKPSNGGKFTYSPAGIEVTWPGGWKQTKLETYEWAIEPADAGDKPDRWIALDIPTLPLHPPGMIPISKVESGYLDDLKKECGKLDVKELTPPKLPDAKERMVRAAWQKDGKSMQQTALLIVHDDHVYIFRGRSETKD